MHETETIHKIANILKMYFSVYNKTLIFAETQDLKKHQC